MNWYSKQVAAHPLIVVFTIGALSIVCFVISITTAKLPNFSDPQLGFETRGTEIAKRLTAWDNLYEAMRPSGYLTANPLENHPPFVDEVLDKATENFFPEGKINVVEEIDDEQPQQKAGKSHSDHNHNHLSNDGFFCEGLSPDYSHLVVEATDSRSLLSYKSLSSICSLQQRLMNHDIMSSICQTVSNGECCKPWSLPNYVALLFNLTTCTNITEEIVGEVKTLFTECSKYFNQLLDCDENYCVGVPPNCTKYNAVHDLLYYLTDFDFFKFNQNGLFLNHSMIFLPIARSSAVLPFYYNLSDFKENNIQISGIDFGLKNALFNDCIIRDGYLMVAGSAFMVMCIWSYTKSLFITLSTVLAVVMSLTNSYFIYTFMFNIKFFPFMNLLAIVVAIGIGADDAFIFYKIWSSFKLEKDSPIRKLLSDTLRHSTASMFVTSLTTAAAFYSNYIGSITAINCFSVFAGTAVLTNFLLMVSWFPACVVLSQKLNCRVTRINYLIATARGRTSQMKVLLHRYLELFIVHYNWLWLFLFTAVAIASSIVVLYYPKLRLPHSRNFHLFQSNHLFERYDSKYRDKFLFEMQEQGWDSPNFKLPLRFVWGILPIDNGNFLEPSSKGTLEFDVNFDMAAPESQAWLLKFCQTLRAQPFYQLTLGPLLSNCFIESFQNWMRRRCVDVSGIDQAPCCESSKFPYPRDVFQTCIVKAISRLFETPVNYFQPGVAGPKFSKSGEIKAVVVEYDSNHSYSMSFQDMHEFYSQVETWFQRELSTAPPGMKSGWFVSHLGFYDLQLALSSGTALAIGVSMAISLAVFFLATLNILISIYTIVTISCIVFVTVGCLVLMGWTINVLESIAVTTVIGLSVDFSLHYGISYRLYIEESRGAAVGFALKRMAGPTLMAALTTGAAGLFMLPSSVLAYIQIGIFLIIVMATSWVYSTIFLMSLLSLAGPSKDFGQLSYGSIFSVLRKLGIKPNSSDANPTGDETHELEALRGSSKHIECVAMSRKNEDCKLVPVNWS